MIAHKVSEAAQMGEGEEVRVEEGPALEAVRAWTPRNGSSKLDPTVFLSRLIKQAERVMSIVGSICTASALVLVLLTHAAAAEFSKPEPVVIVGYGSAPEAGVTPQA